MSRALCNRILFVSAVVALLTVLNYTLFIRPPDNVFQGALEVIGKTALLWPVVALVFGVLIEALLLLTGRDVREHKEREAPGLGSTVGELLGEADRPRHPAEQQADRQMSDAPGPLLSHHVPDDGRWYAQGTIVRIVRGAHIELIPDPNGDYEVHRCERQSYLSSDPLLTVELRKLS